MTDLSRYEFHGQKQKKFDADGLATWRKILTENAALRPKMIHDLFEKGVRQLQLTPDHAPDLEKINTILKSATGFQGLFVDGFEEVSPFFVMLSRRLFPIGNFIRDKQDVNYTPAPDIVHDLFGHLPFLVDKRYADFCQQLGELGCQFLNDAKRLREIERFFWFTIEFALIQTPNGIRVFGAGIASSVGECKYALSGQPEVLPFNVDIIRQQEFKIDEMQKRLFILESVEQLYSSLPELYRLVKTEVKK